MANKLVAFNLPSGMVGFISSDIVKAVLPLIGVETNVPNPEGVAKFRSRILFSEGMGSVGSIDVMTDVKQTMESLGFKSGFDHGKE